MKITVRHKSDSNKVYRFFFILPNFLLKSNLLINTISKHTNKSSKLISNLDEDDKEDIKEIINDSNELINKHTKEIKMFINAIYKELKHYIKKYGHFTLVDIESEDSRIKIII